MLREDKGTSCDVCFEKHRKAFFLFFRRQIQLPSLIFSTNLFALVILIAPELETQTIPIKCQQQKGKRAIRFICFELITKKALRIKELSAISLICKKNKWLL